MQIGIGLSVTLTRSNGAPAPLYIYRVDNVTPLRRVNPNTAFIQRASNLQLLGSLGSYVVNDSGKLVVDDAGAYIYSEA